MTLATVEAEYFCYNALQEVAGGELVRHAQHHPERSKGGAQLDAPIVSRGQRGHFPKQLKKQRDQMTGGGLGGEVSNPKGQKEKEKEKEEKEEREKKTTEHSRILPFSFNKPLSLPSLPLFRV